MRAIKLIKSEKDYHAALERLEEIFEAKPTPQGDELEILSFLIEKYEDEFFPIGPQIQLKQFGFGWIN